MGEWPFALTTGLMSYEVGVNPCVHPAGHMPEGGFVYRHDYDSYFFVLIKILRFNKGGEILAIVKFSYSCSDGNTFKS